MGLFPILWGLFHLKLFKGKIYRFILHCKCSRVISYVMGLFRMLMPIMGYFVSYGVISYFIGVFSPEVV